MTDLFLKDYNVSTYEQDIRQHLAPIEISVREYFSKGVYAREIFIPQGTCLTGKIHKYENLNILSKGRLTVFTDDGEKITVSAPYTVVSPPGTRRAAYAEEDCVWTTIHGTDETDTEKIEMQFIAQTPQEYLAHCETLKIGA